MSWSCTVPVPGELVGNEQVQRYPEQADKAVAIAIVDASGDIDIFGVLVVRLLEIVDDELGLRGDLFEQCHNNTFTSLESVSIIDPGGR